MVGQAMLQILTMMPSWCNMKAFSLFVPWTWNGESTQGHYPADYNEDHIYYYYFVGDGTSEQFGFEDGGGYGDNGGSLNIEIYEMVNQLESNYSLSFDGVDDYVDTGIPSQGL